MISKKDISLIKNYDNMANFISLAMMYVKGGTLTNNLNDIELKEYGVGHFGVAPAINFIYSNLNYIASKYNKKMVVLVGAGHAGNAYLANAFLSKTMIKNNSYSLNSINNLISSFGSDDGFRSEINASYPYTFYDGGELGYSLPTAYGLSLKNDVITIPIIGDGEAETGTISSSWNIHRIFKCKGKILPIINLNGYKMGGISILSTMTDNEIKNYFKGNGYQAYFVSNNHQKFVNLILKCLKQLENNSKLLPVIILKTPKGMTGISNDVIKVEGELISHKNPLATIKDKKIRKEILIEWLKKYDINDKTFIVPDKNKINKYFYDNIKVDKVKNNYLVKENVNNSLSSCSDYFENLIKNDKDYVIFSPDELSSNQFKDLLKYKDNVVEILNENICLSMLIGHLRGGKNGIFISYEGFSSIVLSILSQYKKFLYESQNRRVHSLNILLTSVCWENCYSHQNPEILNNLLIDENKYCNVYFPIDYNSTILTLNKINNSYNDINVIDIPKHDLLSMKLEDATKMVNDKYFIFNNELNPDIILVSTGLYQLKECLEVYEELKNKYKIKLIYIYDTSILKENNDLFKDCNKIIYVFHGYPSAIKQLLYKYNEKVEVLGFNDLSNKSADAKIKLKMNSCSKEDIINIIINK